MSTDWQQIQPRLKNLSKCSCELDPTFRFVSSSFRFHRGKFLCTLHAAPINDVSNKMRTSAKMKNSSDGDAFVLYHMREHALTSSMHTITAVTNQKLFMVNGLLLYYHFCYFHKVSSYSQETWLEYLCAIGLCFPYHNRSLRSCKPFHHDT